MQTQHSAVEQNPSSSVSTNYNGGTAPTGIRAISKGKYKGKGKGKPRERKARQATKEKVPELQSRSTDIKLQHTRKR